MTIPVPVSSLLTLLSPGNVADLEACALLFTVLTLGVWLLALVQVAFEGDEWEERR